MIQENIRQSIENALQSFRIAENEINRPNEDSVAPCVCFGTRTSINHFLNSYLLSKAIENKENQLEKILKQCESFDPNFSAIDLSCFKCDSTAEVSCDSSYCLSADKVNECFIQAKKVKDLVFKKLEISEKDFN